MDLTQLTRPERLALIGLLKWVANADGVVTVDEREVLSGIRELFGADEWRSLYRETQMVFKNPEHLRVFCTREVERPEARKTIYNTLVEMAGADWWDAEEVRILNWVGVTWGLVPREVLDGPDGDFDLDEYDEEI